MGNLLIEILKRKERKSLWPKWRRYWPGRVSGHRSPSIQYMAAWSVLCPPTLLHRANHIRYIRLSEISQQNKGADEAISESLASFCLHPIHTHTNTSINNYIHCRERAGGSCADCSPVTFLCPQFIFSPAEGSIYHTTGPMSSHLIAYWLAAVP